MKPVLRHPLPWASRDGRLIILARGLRAFALGFFALVLGIYLAKRGLSLPQIGLFLSIATGGAAVFVGLLSLGAERVGRRTLFVAFSGLTGAAGLAVALTDNFPLLLLFAFVGNLAGSSGRSGPIPPLEQATLPDTVPGDRRTDVFAAYGIVGTIAAALGALAAGFPSLYAGFFVLSETAAMTFMFVAFAAVMLAAAFVYSRLSSAVERTAARDKWMNPMKLESRRRIFTLTALFSVDRLGGSMIVESLVAYWFFTRFGFELGAVAGIFFVSQVLTATSLWVATKIAGRIGLLNTMVFTHIPSSVFLIAAAFSPAGWLAVLFWQLRSFLGQMDVPTRDSYTMAVVKPKERVAMASIHILGGSVAGTVGPSISTALWHAVSAAAPFVACSVLKIGYDLSLYFTFRHVQPPEEVQRNERQASRART